MEIRKISLADKEVFQEFETAMLRDKEVNPFVEWWETANFENYVADSDSSEIKKEGQAWSIFTRYFAFDKGNILGMLICFWEMAHPDCQKLGHFGYMIAPDYRRQGIAKQLITFAKERYRERGVAEVVVATAEDNLPSRSLLENVGARLEKIETISYFEEKEMSTVYYRLSCEEKK